MPSIDCRDVAKAISRRSGIVPISVATVLAASLLQGCFREAPRSDVPDLSGVTDLYECCPPADCDWPQWRGIHRDGHSIAADISETWPTGGPEELWRKPIGSGFSAISVRGPNLFVACTHDGKETLLHLDAATGEERWRLTMGEQFEEEFGNGPRAAPTIHGAVVLALSSRGRLIAARIEDGSTLWTADLHEKFGGTSFSRGYASSPLVEGDRVIVNAAVAVDDSPSIVALNRSNGSVVWTAGTGRSASSSPIALTIAGERQIVTTYAQGLAGLDANDGRFLWRFPWDTQFGLNIATPVLVPPDKVLVSAAYSQGSALVRLSKDSDWAAEEVWANRKFRNHFNTSIYHDGHLYGFDNTILKCMDTVTGEERWHARGYGKGSLIFAAGKLIVLSENGELALLRADPGECDELARTAVLDGKCWTTPTLANGRLFVRNHSQIVCLRLSPSMVP